MPNKNLRTARHAIAIAAFVAVNAWAQSTGPNKVYLEQIGDNNTITIQQVGGTNNVGGTNGNATVANNNVTTLTPDAPSVNNYATTTGSNNTVTINQTGSNNSAQYNITGSNNTYTSTIVGGNNQTKLTVGTANVAGSSNSITETVTGNTNMIITNVQASNVVSNVSITGSTNQVTQDLLTIGGHATTSITGSNNVVISEQRDAGGGNAHTLVNTISGDYNSIVTQQQGTNDTTINLNTDGNHNTVTVRTSSGSIVGSKTAVAR